MPFDNKINTTLSILNHFHTLSLIVHITLFLSILTKTIKDRQLYAIVVAMVAIVVIVIGVWESVGPWKIETKYLDKEVFIYIFTAMRMLCFSPLF